MLYRVVKILYLVLLVEISTVPRRQHKIPCSQYKIGSGSVSIPRGCKEHRNLGSKPANLHRQTRNAFQRSDSSPRMRPTGHLKMSSMHKRRPFVVLWLSLFAICCDCVDHSQRASLHRPRPATPTNLGPGGLSPAKLALPSSRLRGGKGDWIGGLVGALAGSINDKETKLEMLEGVSQMIRKWERFRAPKLSNQEEVREKVLEVLPATIRMFSGCRDDQTSADVADTSMFGLPSQKKTGLLGFLKGPDAGGACTSAMMLSLTRKPKPTWIELLDDMRTILVEKSFSQVPQLSSSRQIQLSEEFHLKQSGRRTKALFIGINYVGHEVGELRGCHNDVRMMQDFVGKHGYDRSQMMVLMDDGRNPMPTLRNILEAFRWLVDGAEAGDSLFLHYSGHGGQIEDDNGDEKDGFDETLLPVDYQTAGMIRDDTLYEMVCAPLPAGCMLTVVMDCCHSGSALDLPYMFTCSAEGSEKVHAGLIEGLLVNADFSWEMAVQVLLRALKAVREKGEEAKRAVGAGVELLKEKGHSDVEEFVARMGELQAKGEQDVAMLVQIMQEVAEKAEAEETRAALAAAVQAVQRRGRRDVRAVVARMKEAWEEKGKEDVRNFVAGVQGLSGKIGSGFQDLLGKKPS